MASSVRSKKKQKKMIPVSSDNKDFLVEKILKNYSNNFDKSTSERFARIKRDKTDRAGDLCWHGYVRADRRCREDVFRRQEIHGGEKDPTPNWSGSGAWGYAPRNRSWMFRCQGSHGSPSSMSPAIRLKISLTPCSTLSRMQPGSWDKYNNAAHEGRGRTCHSSTSSPSSRGSTGSCSVTRA